MTTTPAWSTIQREATRRIISESVAGGRPGRVEAYDPKLQLARVQPLILVGKIDPSTGDRVVEPEPVLNDVPVLMLGTKRARITMDIKPGDTVWIMPCMFALGPYLVQGGQIDPQDDRRHHITDNVCLPAVFDFAHVPADASTDGEVIHAAKLRLGGPQASDPVARKSDLDAVVAKLNGVIDALKAHFHTGVTAGSGVSGTSAATAALIDMTAPACSPVVKSK